MIIIDYQLIFNDSLIYHHHIVTVIIMRIIIDRIVIISYMVLFHGYLYGCQWWIWISMDIYILINLILWMIIHL